MKKLSETLHPLMTRLMAMAAALALTLGAAGCSMPLLPSESDDASASSGTTDMDKSAPPATTPDDGRDQDARSAPRDRAQEILDSMTTDQKIGQLVMVPLFAGNDASSIGTWITDYHAGSVLLLGNWRTGVTGVSQTSAALQSYAKDNAQLLICADQEGGQVQHLTGAGFDTMPSAVEQGRMTTDQLRADAATWGRQLHDAGVNVNLAPVTDTVQTSSRAQNAPIGALDRDFGLDVNGNAMHAAAFIDGMHDAGVMATIKHFPGLGGVTGNTDFTAQGTADAQTTLSGGQIEAFAQALNAGPDMVMMSLATYTAIDPGNPAAFSSTILNDHLRGTLGYQGVVTSDSVSAEALGGIPVNELGVRFVSAGGDLICIGANEYVKPIVQGLRDRVDADPAFARQVDQSALRVLTLKCEKGLA